jgi:hypothetical protein
MVLQWQIWSEIGMKKLQTQAAYVWEGVKAKYGHTNKYVQQAYIHGPRKSTRQASHKLNVP